MSQFFDNKTTTTWALKHGLLLINNNNYNKKNHNKLIDHNKFSRCMVKENKGFYYRYTTHSVKQQLNENS